MEAYIQSNGKRIAVHIDENRRLGWGATATVYAVASGGYDHAAKIYRGPQALDRRKIDAMLAFPPNPMVVRHNGKAYPQFAWPTHLVTNADGEAIGYLMPRIDEKEALIFNYFYDPALADWKTVKPQSLSEKLQIARNLSLLLTQLHARRHFMIDFKPENVKVFGTPLYVALLDCDSFSIWANRVRFPATNYTSEYIAPEALRHKRRPRDLGEDQDLFALAVVLFQLLNNGIHPFQGIETGPPSSPSSDDKVRKGLYAYGHTANPAISPRPESIHLCWDDRMLALFHRAFAGKPNERPRAAEWKEHFQNLIDNKALRKCDKNSGDPMHIRFADKPCPACHVAAARAKLLEPRAPDLVPAVASCVSCGQAIGPPAEFCPGCGAVQDLVTVRDQHDSSTLDVTGLGACVCCLGSADAVVKQKFDGGLTVKASWCRSCRRRRGWRHKVRLPLELLSVFFVVGVAMEILTVSILWMDVPLANALTLTGQVTATWLFYSKFKRRQESHAKGCNAVLSALKVPVKSGGNVVGYEYRIRFGNTAVVRRLRPKGFRIV